MNHMIKNVAYFSKPKYFTYTKICEPLSVLVNQVGYKFS